MKKFFVICSLVLLLVLFTSVTYASNFSWDMAEGTTITVLFNQHTYSEAVIKKISEFEDLTGIKVNHTVIPEENYFDKLSIYLNSRAGDPDVFMTGAYQIWDYAPAGYLQELDKFIDDTSLTAPDYNIDDFFEGILGALRWDLVPGHKTGTGLQWAVPMAFEQYTLAYNKRIFEEKGLEPPKTMEELLEVTKALDEFDGKGSYALALRGTRNWATIHPGYMTTYANYGAKDIVIEDDRLVSRVNSPEAVEMTEMWLDLIHGGGASNWSTYTWYQASADLGAGKAAMLFDADVVEYFQNPEGASKEAGNLAWVPAPMPEDRLDADRKSNLWVWSLAMNKYSRKQEAAWLFMQYFTNADYQLWAALNAKCVNPARESVFNNSEFQSVVSKADGYSEAFEATVDGTGIQFTPQPKFFELTTEWASTLQDLVAGNYDSTQEAMDELKVKMDKALSDVELE
ncbi:extracellular solute-binding protein [Iocasia frigidifontis]|uniref:Extracellular solute-binding protein n=1 Tax=Iocasia fonsfrigidae TaxID=2682810 RepID=A0A8A7KIY1_9FIRM|nr:sugar ABC transporter substrate-binding protein [Iocasia fonsfrigidae]QTL99549.1 extracellular solute-binding protein [Iocasia fonsfrigidae]